MINTARRIVGAIALISALVLPFSAVAPAYADDDDGETPPIDLGICGVYYYSGLSIVDSQGRTVSVEEYCQTLSLSPEAIVNISTEEPDIAFWQAFLVAASPTAIEFANAAGQLKVVEYGRTICPFLRSGNSIDDLRQKQAQSSTPPSFEAAVTVAAINTYCTEYRSEIGRY